VTPAVPDRGPVIVTGGGGRLTGNRRISRTVKAYGPGEADRLPDEKRGRTVAASSPNPGSAMPGYKVTPEDLSAAASYVDMRASDIESKIAALGVYVNDLNGYWHGPAHSQFETLMTDYSIYATMLQNALTDIASGLRGNYVNYSSAEATNLRNIVKVKLPAAKFGS
jgi:ESAT-6 family protein